jgi:4-hydroxy-4-methyl-2-oxoglutarate aldolase
VGSAASNAGLGALCALDGAAIANAIETFGVRLRNEGFADCSIRSLFPDLPPAAGYAVTARIRCSTPPPVGYQYTDRTDWWQYILSVPAPRFVVVEDVDARPGLGGFVGELHATILRALDCVGYATNGSVRDVDAVRARVGLPLFASGVAVSHAFAHVVEFGEPVQIGGLRVGSGDLLFGDAHGVQSVPPQLVERIPDAVARMMAHERKIIALCRSTQFSIDALTRLVRSSR